jgi:uncharacterized membrane protein YhiD involved in acid resistance
MNKYLYEILQKSTQLGIREIALQIFVATCIGFLIYVSYHISHIGTIYSKKFNVSLVILTVLTTTVMTVIGDNVALSLGMVGALSIVRFRTAIKDPRDTVYIFWTIIAGLSCGSGSYSIALMGSGAVFIILLLLGRIKNENRYLLIIRGSRNNGMKIESIVFEHFNKKAQMKVKNTTEDSVEYIFEISKNIIKKLQIREDIVDVLYKLENIEYVNLVLQNDEIGS